MVSFALLVLPFAAALMVAVLVIETSNVFTRNVALVEPAGIVSVLDAGFANSGFELLSVSVMPTGAAAHSSVTVAVEPEPSLTDCGESTRLSGWIGRIVNESLPYTSPALPQLAVTVPV